jgi:hypothetical protein
LPSPALRQINEIRARRYADADLIFVKDQLMLEQQDSYLDNLLSIAQNKRTIL